MTSQRPPRPPTGPITTILANLRRTPRRIRRQSLDALENVASQLFDAAARQPHIAISSGEYRIDDLARLAGTTTRNVRAYRDRGLLPPPRRVGRIALFNDAHLTRLRLITSMLDRGYNLTHVHEMLSAWEQGKDLGDVLGLESALVGTWAAEKPEIIPRSDLENIIGDDRAFDRLVALQLVTLDGANATVTRPKLFAAFNEIREYGIDINKLIDLHEQVLPHIDTISAILVQAGADHIANQVTLGQALPEDHEIADLITMLVRFRTQAVASVAGTLASSIESTIESLISRFLADFIATSSDAESS